jgi:hypothetical protein
MSFWDQFRKPKPITNQQELEIFCDSRAAFMVQKCVYEYARNRAGVRWQKLFKEAAFLEAMDRSRWLNYPVCLSNVLHMVYLLLVPEMQDRSDKLSTALVATGLRILKTHEPPDLIDEEEWAAAGQRLEAYLRSISALGAMPVRDIPLKTFDVFFAQMPLHASLMAHDTILLSNNLRMSLIGAHDQFLKIAKTDKLVQDLL